MDQNYEPDEMRDQDMLDPEFGERMPEPDENSQADDDQPQSQTQAQDHPAAPKPEDDFMDKAKQMGNDAKDKFKF